MSNGGLYITKRDGKQEAFSLDKIKIAISKAFLASGFYATDEDLNAILSRVRVTNGITVEEIQNQVETALMAEQYYTVAKNYILYRQKHTEDREIHMSKDLLIKYIMPHFKKMKYLVVSLDLDFWWKTPSGKDDNWFADDANAKYLLYPGFVYDRNHDYWAGEEDLTPLYEATKEGILYSSNRTDNIIELRGQLHTTCAKSWPGASFGATISDPGQEIIRGSMNSLKTIIEESAKRGVTVIGTILPQSPAYKGSKYFGYLGMSRSIADSLIGEFTQMQNTYSNFVLFDENKGGEHDYAGGMNEDAQHLCDEGAKIYTQRLDSLLLELDSNP